jgi:hypothetical protein
MLAINGKNKIVVRKITFGVTKETIGLFKSRIGNTQNPYHHDNYDHGGYDKLFHVGPDLLL